MWHLCRQPAQIKANMISLHRYFDICVVELLRILAFRNIWRWKLCITRQLCTSEAFFFVVVLILIWFILFVFWSYWSASQGQILFCLFFIHNSSDLDYVFGIWLALNKNLLPEWLNPLWRAGGSNHHFSLSRLLFNRITDMGQRIAYQQIQKVFSANNCGSAPQGNVLNYTSIFTH